MTNKQIPLMVNWRSWWHDTPVNRVQLAVSTTFLFSFFLLIIVVQIPSAILEDDEFEITIAHKPLCVNQSGYEPLNLENGSFLNSDNFDATDSRF